jgi:hypothetical protein
MKAGSTFTVEFAAPEAIMVSAASNNLTQAAPFLQGSSAASGKQQYANVAGGDDGFASGFGR